MKFAFWHRLKAKHPILYEVFQWAVLAIALIGLILNLIVTFN